MTSSRSFVNFRRMMFLITGCFLLVIAGVCTVAGVSRYYAREGTRQTATLTGRLLPGLVTLARLEEAALKLKAIAVQSALAKDEAAMRAQEEAFKAESAHITQYVADLKSADDSEEARGHIAGFVTAVQAYGTAAAALQAQLKAGDFEKAMATLDREIAAGQQRLEAQLRELSEYFFVRARETGETSSALIAQSSRFGTIATGAVATATTVFMGFALVSARRVAWRLRDTSRALQSATGIVQENAGVLAASSETMSQGATEQAASLEESSASLEEINSMTKRNAESAEKAKSLARDARTAADDGSRHMDEMIGAMGAIKTSSDNIAKIIKTIDEIAFQTNLLALNAAVEAARAGDAGMGFAVVADEVRSLAQRSALAAKETAEKIDDSIAKSGAGVAISARVAESLTHITAKTRQVDELVAEIATASSEQTRGVSQVSIAVAEMDKITQSNAANAEETAAAAEQLNAQALRLHENVTELIELIGKTGAETLPEADATRGADAAMPRTNGAGFPVVAKNGRAINRRASANGSHDSEFGFVGR
ncbi:MAG TPA: methyl-accepting chemotaxis protein [Opitutaceae bacterium]|nr:methyl-accepting chemotaxis protein [Opitutaceae bacterium]